MFKKVLFSAGLCVCSFGSHSNEIGDERFFQPSVGIGLQYGGYIGGQLALTSKSDKYFASIGYLGTSVGYQHTIGSSASNSIGINVGVGVYSLDDYTRFGVVTYNYHLSGFSERGFVFGLNAGVMKATDSDFIASFDVGYKF